MRLIEHPAGEIPPPRRTEPEIDGGAALFPLRECPPGAESDGLPRDKIAKYRSNTWRSAGL
ncbi:MAG: hypothetical protein WBU92_01430 [Candidatus Dormiibacterota bacterium]